MPACQAVKFRVPLTAAKLKHTRVFYSRQTKGVIVDLPTYSPPNFDSIPEELKQRDQWVLWRAEVRNGKITKIPYNARTGAKAASDNPETWSSFAEARRAYEVEQNSDGIGFVFSADDPYCGIDLDQKGGQFFDEDGELTEAARDIIETIASYTEYSPSGGIHIIARASLPEKGRRKGDLEMYDSVRYFTVTGNAYFRYEEIRDAQEGVSAVHSAYILGESKPLSQSSSAPSTRPAPSDLDLQSKILTSNIGIKFSALMQGDTSSYPSASEADYALCRILAWWTKDAGQIDRIFRSSGLFREEKWNKKHKSDGTTYGELTIANALKNTVGGYDPESYKASQPMVEWNDPETGKTKAIVGEQINDLHLLKYEPTDEGNAEAFIALFGSEFAYVAEWGWLWNAGTHWDTVSGEGELKKKIVETLRRRAKVALDAERDSILKASKTMNGRINATAEVLQKHLAARPEDFDGEPHLLNCLNGVVDLRTGEITPHSEHQGKFTYVVPTAYVPDADYQAWHEWICGTIKGGAKVAEYMQTLAGYCATGDTREEIFVFAYGEPRAGKGVYTETVRATLGDTITREVTIDLFMQATNPDAQNFALAPLKPVRALFASEPDEGQWLNARKMKNITGGNAIYCAHKGKPHFNYVPQFKVLMTSNFAPKSNPSDRAFWESRIKVIEFPHSHIGKEDKTLKSRMRSQENREAVLAWIVDGAIRFYREGLNTPPEVKIATEAARNDVDSVAQWFDETFIAEEGAWVANEMVLWSYEKWCKENKVDELSNRAFVAALRAKGFINNVQRRDEGRNKKGWVGFRHKRDDESTTPR